MSKWKEAREKVATLQERLDALEAELQKPRRSIAYIRQEIESTRIELTDAREALDVEIRKNSSESRIERR